MDMNSLNRYLLPAVLLACVSTCANAAEAENGAGKIHFTGQIIEPSCEIKGDSGTDSTVELGTYPTSLFQAVNDESTLTPFTIKLTGCPATSDGLAAVQLTFNGVTTLSKSTTILDVSAISTQPGTTAAAGVGIAVSPKEDDTQLIAFDGSDDQVWVKLAASASTDIAADFNARYKAYSIPVTAGPADADLTVNILYR